MGGREPSFTVSTLECALAIPLPGSPAAGVSNRCGSEHSYYRASPPPREGEPPSGVKPRGSRRVPSVRWQQNVNLHAWHTKATTGEKGPYGGVLPVPGERRENVAVIVDLTIPADEFELGQILQVEAEAKVTVETMVPLGGQPLPFVRVHDSTQDRFESTVQSHPSVSKIQLVNSHEGELLYALDWEPSAVSLIQTILDLDGVILMATGTSETWSLELRFGPTGRSRSFKRTISNRGCRCRSSTSTTRRDPMLGRTSD